MRRLWLVCLLVCHAATAAVIAEATFADGPERYADTPYFWLGNGPLTISIATPPSSGQSLSFWWGSKEDDRSANVVINGVRVPVQAGGHNSFAWIEVAIPAGAIKGEAYTVRLEQGGPGKAAFFAGVRLVGEPIDDTPKITWAQAGISAGTEAFPDLRGLWDRPPPDDWFGGLDERWRAAETNGRYQAEALYRCRKFLDGWYAVRDPLTGLVPQRLGKPYWEPHNSAADNYPFMVLSAELTDSPLYEGYVVPLLATEQRVTNRLGVLPDTYNLETHAFQYPDVKLDRLVFGASEYIKDGLLPLTEWKGPSPWADRMIAMLDAMWDAAPIRTPHGRIVSTNIEINGEMLQTLSRLYWFTGREEYLEYAIRLGDYYLLGDHHPTRDLHQLRLRDHGCEVVSGLCELYATCHFAKPAKAREYRAPLHEMLDRILDVGRNEHGLVYNVIDPVAGKPLNKGLADTWGYDLNGYYTVWLLDGTTTYREAVLKALRNLGHYRNFAWEGRSHDGYADSIESALNLYNREPEATAGDWIDSETRVMFGMQQPNGRIGDWYGDGNFARTAIMVALWKSQGVTAHPWREDLRVGAVADGDMILLCAAADQPWHGSLVFDIARHAEDLHLPLDWPRINQFPEWFVVEPERQYEVTDPRTGSRVVWDGEVLRRGLDLRLQPGTVWQRIVTPLDNGPSPLPRGELEGGLGTPQPDALPGSSAPRTPVRSVAQTPLSPPLAGGRASLRDGE